MSPLIWKHSIIGKTIPRFGRVSHTMTPFSKHVLTQYLANAHQDIYTSKQLRLMIQKDEKDIGTIELFDFEPTHLDSGCGYLDCG